MMGALRGCRAVKFDSCNNLLSSVHTALVGLISVRYVRLNIIVHVISVKHFTSGYQSEILHAVYIPSKLRNSTGRQPVHPQMWSGRSKSPTGQWEICKLL